MSTIILKDLSSHMQMPPEVADQFRGLEVTLATAPSIGVIGQPTVGSTEALAAYEALQFEYGYLVSSVALYHAAKIAQRKQAAEWVLKQTDDFFCILKGCCEYQP